MDIDKAEEEDAEAGGTDVVGEETAGRVSCSIFGFLCDFLVPVPPMTPCTAAPTPLTAPVVLELPSYLWRFLITSVFMEMGRFS